MQSILTIIKQMLGLAEADTHFDQEIIVHINSVLMTLSQIGIGPVSGFSISDASTTWLEYLGEETKLEAVKSYMYLKVRLIFDPPTSGFVVDAFERQATELESRLCIQADPTPEIVITEEVYE